MVVRIDLAEGADLTGFRKAVRRLVGAGIAPDDVVWSSGEGQDLFGDAVEGEAPPIALPRAVTEIVAAVICHRDLEKHALLYTLIWRILRGERAVLDMHADPLVHRLAMMRKAIRRDLHKMHAFVRFRRIGEGEEERFLAWFEPDHFILEATAQFFVDRFRGLDWTIVTPIGSLRWDRVRLQAGPPGRRSDVPDSDAFEAAWLGYYESIFNPARANETAMRAEMPKKYWRNMPETASIPGLLAGAPARMREMIAREAAPPVKRDPQRAVAAMARPQPASLEDLNRQIEASAPFVTGGTRAVLGEGPAHAAIAFVGEQPGDQEDVASRPFVGPAGQLLMRALAEAGLRRESCYLTNAVKHFKFVQRGKLRLHQKPTAGEVAHYRWWLERELDFVAPRLVVALGATAVLALAGKALPVTRARGPHELAGRPGYVTVHPAYLLRLPDEAAKKTAWNEFVADLRQARTLAENPAVGAALPG